MASPTDGIWWSVGLAIMVNGLMVAFWFMTGHWKHKRV
jgi:Na+-driven multidrug efflux pump